MPLIPLLCVSALFILFAESLDFGRFLFRRIYCYDLTTGCARFIYGNTFRRFVTSLSVCLSFDFDISPDWCGRWFHLALSRVEYQTNPIVDVVVVDSQVNEIVCYSHQGTRKPCSASRDGASLLLKMKMLMSWLWSRLDLFKRPLSHQVCARYPLDI